MSAVLVRVAVLHCACGTVALDAAVYPDSRSAWEAACEHVARSRGVCTPELTWDYVPPALAPKGSTQCVAQ